MKIVFSFHAEERSEFRNISRYEIYDIINFPDIVAKKYGKHFYRKKLERGTIEVVCEKKENILKVVTLYWL